MKKKDQSGFENVYKDDKPVLLSGFTLAIDIVLHLSSQSQVPRGHKVDLPLRNVSGANNFTILIQRPDKSWLQMSSIYIGSSNIYIRSHNNY